MRPDLTVYVTKDGKQRAKIERLPFKGWRVEATIGGETTSAHADTFESAKIALWRIASEDLRALLRLKWTD